MGLGWDRVVVSFGDWMQCSAVVVVWCGEETERGWGVYIVRRICRSSSPREENNKRGERAPDAQRKQDFHINAARFHISFSAADLAVLVHASPHAMHLALK